MVISFGINRSSLVAQGRLGEAIAKNTKVQEQLSSGLRINKASDDAAGLAVLSDLNARSKVYSQGIRNLNDGISLLSVADSAVSALSDITVRLNELATQASNGSFSSKQRGSLDAEAQALSKEFTRIIQSTKFNNIGVLSGDLASGLRLQAGYGEDGGLSSGLGGVQGTGVFVNLSSSSNSTAVGDLQLGDIDNDGFLDMVAVSAAGIFMRKGDGSGGFGASVSLGIGGQRVGLVDLNNDGNLDVVGMTASGGAILANVKLGSGNGTFGSTQITTVGAATTTISGLSLNDVDNDGRLDILTFSQDTGAVSVARGNGDGTFGSYTSYAGLTNNYQQGDYLQVGDINNDGNLDFAIITNGNYTSSRLQVRLGSGDGSFGSAMVTTINLGSTSAAAFRMADFDGDGNLDVVATFGPS